MDETNRTRRTRITNAHQKAADKAAAEAKTPYQRGALAAVEEFMLKNPGAHLWASDIMEATGLDKRRVQAAVSDLIRRGGYADRITVLRPGNAWRMKEQASKGRKPVDLMAEPKRRPTEPWDPEQGPEPGGKWDPEAAPPSEPSEPKWELRAVGGYPDGSVAISINGQPYHAKPLS